MTLEQKWEEVKSLIEEIQPDLIKNSNGNKSAGIRTRKKIKELSVLLKELKALSLEIGKKNDQ